MCTIYHTIKLLQLNKYTLGAGGRGFESRYPDITKLVIYLSDFQLIKNFNFQL